MDNIPQFIRGTEHEAAFREGGLSHSKAMPMADMDMEWDAGEQMKKASADDMKQMAAAVMGDPENKSSYVLPHHTVDGKVVWNAVKNAAARFNQVKWDSEETKKAAASHLATHYKQFKKEMPELMKESAPSPENDQRGSEDFEIRLAAKVNGGSGTKWGVTLIEEGKSLSGHYYSADVLQKSVPLFEGARCYINHPSIGATQNDRPVQDIVGFYENVRCEAGKGLVADWNVLANSQYPWLPGFLKELKERNKLDLIGLSLLGYGKAKMGKVDGSMLKIAESIDIVRSVDLVDVPGAGGKVENLIAASLAANKSVLEDLKAMEGIEKMTPEELKAAAPQLFELIRNAAASEPLKAVAEDAKKALEALQKERCNITLQQKLSESGLPKSMQSKIEGSYRDTVFEVAKLDNEIKVYRESVAEVQSRYAGPYIPTITETVTVEDKVQAAFDKLMGNEVEEKFKTVRPFRGIREAYLMITGDEEFSWKSNTEQSLFREAVPTAAKVVGGGTITFANILNTSMNKRLLKEYKGQDKWWEPIVTKVRLENLKQQDRNRPKNFGSLTERTTGGAEYTELTWAENVETYSPTEYGNIVPIAQRAIINDDLRALQACPRLMAKSAVLTLNEYVSNLFTQNSGTGPALADGFNVFDATNHQSNKATGVLNRANLKTADITIRKMTDESSKRLSLSPEYLLVAPDDRFNALELVGSPLVPDSANNAVNIFYKELKVIPVPNWTDTDAWYLLTGPSQVDLLELGFLFGKEEPETWIQSDPEARMPFEFDVIAYKIRHRYGGDWLDFRGAYGSIPA